MTEIDVHLLQRFGPLMTTDEVAEVLKFSSPNAFRMALRRKKLILRSIAVPGRRIQYFETQAVASQVLAWVRHTSQLEEENTM